MQQMRLRVLAPWWMPVFAAANVLLHLPSPAHGQGLKLQPKEWPLTSVGRVNVITGAGRRSQCTGTLIGPRHVLTAAHCLFNAARRVWAHPTSIHFVAGYMQGEFNAHSPAVSYVKDEGFSMTTPAQPTAVARDWAIIELAETINLKPISVQPLSENGVASSQVVRAGYRKDRAHVLTVQQNCSVMAASNPAPLLLHSCSSVPGESGSPLLQAGSSGEPEIIGILAASSRGEGESPSLAVPSSTFVAAVEVALKRSIASGQL